jgi:hypothetical protein
MKIFKRISINIPESTQGEGLTDYLKIKLAGKLPIPESKTKYVKTSVSFYEKSKEYKRLVRYADSYFDGKMASAIAYILKNA